MKPFERLRNALRLIETLLTGPPNTRGKTSTAWTAAIMRDLAISPNDLPAIARGTFRQDETRRQR